jgi:thiol-disulfide isomerase/thioredoxin
MKTLLRSLMSIALLAFAATAFALEIVPYTPETLAEAQLAGKPVALQFHADWCPSCRAQDKILESFKADAALPVTVFVADYDNVRELRMALRVGSQSTIIFYHGKKQTARSVFEINPERLRTAFKSTL